MTFQITDDMRILITGAEVSLLHGCSRRTWRLWDVMGYTPQPVTVGRSKFWKHLEVVAWIDAGCPKRDLWVYREKKSK
jgi:predicted DNA-binding transcriptional regulator AlpA